MKGWFKSVHHYRPNKSARPRKLDGKDPKVLEGPLHSRDVFLEEYNQKPIHLVAPQYILPLIISLNCFKGSCCHKSPRRSFPALLDLIQSKKTRHSLTPRNIIQTPHAVSLADIKRSLLRLVINSLSSQGRKRTSNHQFL